MKSEKAKIEPIAILLVEDDPVHTELVRNAFAPQAARVRLTVARDLQDARTNLAVSIPDLVIAEFFLPDGKATELLPANTEEPPYPVLIMTSNGDAQLAVEAMKAGALDYVVKSETTLVDMPRLAERALREWSHIIKRKRAELALQASEEKWRSLVENAPDIIMNVDRDGTIRFVNRTVPELTPEQVVGSKVYDYIPPEHHDTIRNSLAQVVQTGEANRYEIAGVGPKNQIAWYASRVGPIKHNGQVVGATIVTTDITQRKQAEEALRDSEQRYQRLVEHAGDAFFLHDTEGRILDVNQRACESLGYTRAELLTRSVADIDTVWTGERITEAVRHLVPGAPVTAESTQRRKDGTTFPIEVRAGLLEIGGTELILSLVRDISGRKQVEKEREAYAQMLEAIRRMQSDFIAELPADELFNNLLARLLELTGSEYGFIGEILYKDAKPYLNTKAIMNITWNEEMRKFYEENAPEGMKFYNLNTLFGQVMATGGPVISNQPAKDPRAGGVRKGHPPLQSFLGVPIYCRDRLVGVAGMANRPGGYNSELVEFLQPLLETSSHIIEAYRNNARRQRAEEEQARLETRLRQSQKLETIGTLAGGIAHDFNNLLTVICGYADMAIDDLSEGTQARSNLEEVLKAGHRAKDLVQQILTFSRQMEQERQAVKVHLIVKEVLTALQAMLPAAVEIRQAIDTDCGTVIADPTQIHQVLMNLCTNAYDAMREGGGVLTVSLDMVEVGIESTETHPNLQEGVYIRLTVSDTGHGMNGEIIDRIFEPFFTTKGVREGTGLGLSVAYGILLSHGGELTVSSELGKGTTFRAYLPQADDDTEWKMPTDEPLLRGEERILFVDDEEMIARLIKQMLVHCYKVTIMTSSVEALQVFDTQPNAFDIVITDMTMPDMTGVELAKELIRLRSNIPIILVTGFSELITAETAKEVGVRGYLTKPIAIGDLSRAIRRVLDYNTEKEG